MELVDQRADADWLRLQYVASERRVCGLMGMAVASYRYRTTRSDEPLRTQLVELARSKPRFGYRRLHVLLGRSGEHVNHKRVHRIMRGQTEVSPYFKSLIGTENRGQFRLSPGFPDSAPA